VAGGANLYTTLEPFLSASRILPYLRASQGNQKLAIELYQWNIELSGATYQALHIVEVALRNVIDAQLRVWNHTQTNKLTGQLHSADWLVDPSEMLEKLLWDGLPKARRHARKATKAHRRQPGHEDILAQLSFATWRYLLPDNSNRRKRLWADALHKAFPYLTRSKEDLVADVDQLYELRNRVAHLEPLLQTRTSNHNFSRIRQVLKEISPDLEQWFISQQQVTRVLRQRPTK
jgi:hypothetical protein